MSSQFFLFESIISTQSHKMKMKMKLYENGDGHDPFGQMGGG